MSSEYTAPQVYDQAFWTGNTATEPVAYDFHLDNGGPISGVGIEAEYEPHAPIIHTADDLLTDDEVEEFEARINREEQAEPDPLESVRRHLSNALRSAQESADLDAADAISRDLLAALHQLSQVKGGGINV